MTEVVVDASVVVKWYIPEAHHGPARALRDDYLEGIHDLVAPSLLPFEVVNALKYSGHYDGDRLVEAADTLPEYGIELIPFQSAGDVATVATRLDIPVYDASYVALAESTDSILYTANSRLLDDLDDEYADRAEHIRAY